MRRNEMLFARIVRFPPPAIDRGHKGSRQVEGIDRRDPIRGGFPPYQKDPEMSKRVLMIAHGGRCCGMGHVMRSAALAEAFLIEGACVDFLSKYDTGRDALLGKGFDLVEISEPEPQTFSGFSYGTEDSLFREISAVDALLAKSRYDLIVLDSYNVSAEYFRMLHRHQGYVCYLDDLHLLDYPADIILNGAAWAEEVEYETCSAEKLLGPSYLPMRREFQDIPSRAMREKVDTLLVTMGGSDLENVTRKILSLVLRMRPELEIHVLVGAGYRFKDLLDREFGNNVHLHENPDRVSSVMMRCDLAVSSAGTTLYELGVCSVPTLAVAVADNQQAQAEWLAEHGMITYLGLIGKMSDEAFTQSLERMMTSHALRRRFVERFRNLNDGKGARRAASRLLQLVEAKAQ